MLAFEDVDIRNSLFSNWRFWNVDGAVGRRVVLLWAILMYIGKTWFKLSQLYYIWCQIFYLHLFKTITGQGLKDIIRWPRPSCPPVVRLEKKWEKEYGMPSTHAVVGAAVPFSTIIFTASRYQVISNFKRNKIIKCQFAYNYNVCVCFSTLLNWELL